MFVKTIFLDEIGSTAGPEVFANLLQRVQPQRRSNRITASKRRVRWD